MRKVIKTHETTNQAGTPHMFMSGQALMVESCVIFSFVSVLERGGKLSIYHTDSRIHVFIALPCHIVHKVYHK